MRENNGGKYVRLSVMMFVQFAAVGFVGLFSEEKYRADVWKRLLKNKTAEVFPPLSD